MTQLGVDVEVVWDKEGEKGGAGRWENLRTPLKGRRGTRGGEPQGYKGSRKTGGPRNGHDTDGSGTGRGKGPVVGEDDSEPGPRREPPSVPTTGSTCNPYVTPQRGTHTQKGSKIRAISSPPESIIPVGEGKQHLVGNPKNANYRATPRMLEGAGARPAMPHHPLPLCGPAAKRHATPLVYLAERVGSD